MMKHSAGSARIIVAFLSGLVAASIFATANISCGTVQTACAQEECPDQAALEERIFQLEGAVAAIEDLGLAGLAAELEDVDLELVVADVEDLKATIADREVSVSPNLGMIAPFGAKDCPPGWLPADGTEVPRTDYPDLFDQLGTGFGGDGSSTFALPDLRGEFIRGWDAERGVDTGRTLGSVQGDEFGSHSHPLRFARDGAENFTDLSFGTGSTEKEGAIRIPHSDMVTGERTTGASSDGPSDGWAQLQGTHARGGAETRPRNLALQYCISIGEA